MSDRITFDQFNCRLKTDLSDDCLLVVLEYLDPGDLVTLGLMDVYFKDLIYKDVIYKKKIIMGSGDIYSDIDMLKLYGKRLKTVKYVAPPFVLREFLHLIVRHCSEEMLNNIEFDFSYFLNFLHHKRIDQELARQVMNHFRNLEKVSIVGNWHLVPKSFRESIFPKLIANSKKLRFLKLNRIQPRIGRAMIRWPQLLNITELHLCEARVSLPEFIRFINQRPKLEKFVNYHTFTGNEIEYIGLKMGEYCVNTIRSFNDTHKYDSVPEIIPRYLFLGKFENLTEATMTTYLDCTSDLFFGIKSLTNWNKIEKLCVYQPIPRNLPELNDRRPGFGDLTMTNLSSLHTLEFRIDHSTIKENSYFLSIFIGLEFQILHQVRSIYLAGANITYDDFPTELIRGAVNFRKISVWELKNVSVNSHVQRLVEDIRAVLENRRHRENTYENNPNDFIEVLANAEQWQEFMKRPEEYRSNEGKIYLRKMGKQDGEKQISINFPRVIQEAEEESQREEQHDMDM